MKITNYLLLLFVLVLTTACPKDSNEPEILQPPTDAALMEAITLDGVSTKTNGMAVGMVTIAFKPEVLTGAKTLTAYLNQEEVARANAAPFTLPAIDTRQYPDGAYELRIEADYTDGSRRTATFSMDISNVLLKLNNNLYDLRSDHANDYGYRVAITDKNGDVLAWEDIREGGEFTFYAPQGFYDKTIAINAIDGDELPYIDWLSYAGIPRGMTWSNKLGEEKGKYDDYRQQIRRDFEIDCYSCPSSGSLLLSTDEWGMDRINLSSHMWPYMSSVKTNKIDPYLVGVIEQENNISYGYTTLNSEGLADIPLTTFQTYTAQKQNLSASAISADVYVKLVPDQRWPISLSEAYKSNGTAGQLHYLLPSLQDVAAYYTAAQWEVAATNSLGMLEAVYVQVKNEAPAEPRPVSRLNIQKTGFRDLAVNLQNEQQATYVVYAWEGPGTYEFAASHLQFVMAGEHFQPIRLEQIFEGTQAADFEQLTLTFAAVEYMPNMSIAEFLDIQKDSYFPVSVYPFFHGLSEVRQYAYFKDYDEEGGRIEKSKRGFTNPILSMQNR